MEHMETMATMEPMETMDVMMLLLERLQTIVPIHQALSVEESNELKERSARRPSRETNLDFHVEPRLSLAVWRDCSWCFGPFSCFFNLRNTPPRRRRSVSFLFLSSIVSFQSSSTTTTTTYISFSPFHWCCQHTCVYYYSLFLLIFDVCFAS